MIEYKTTVCPYCNRSYLYATPNPTVKCCGDLLPVGFVKFLRATRAPRSINDKLTNEMLSKDQLTERYRAHWDALHRLPQTIPIWIAREAKQLYKRWRAGIPSSSCECAKKWDEIERNNPPDFSSPEAFFEWSWARHNDVNRKLGRSEITLAEAQSIYQAKCVD